MDLFTKTRIMGILNVTPDSFYDGGKYNSIENAVTRALKMFEEGADIIDIGGESTRPGAEQVSISEEIERVVPVIERIIKRIPVPVSIDTTKSLVAAEAVKAGASIINDISGLTFDPTIVKVAAENKTGLVINHIKGTPADMQKNTGYNNIIEDILDFLNRSINIALNGGVSGEKIIIDPGIGFGKSLEQNYFILNNIMEFRKTGYPVLIGLSRKSLIGKLYPGDEDRLPATIALNAVAVNNGADIIRVHDVRAHRLAMDSIDFLKRAVF